MMMVKKRCLSLGIILFFVHTIAAMEAEVVAASEAETTGAVPGGSGDDSAYVQDGETSEGGSVISAVSAPRLTTFAVAEGSGDDTVLLLEHDSGDERPGRSLNQLASALEQSIQAGKRGEFYQLWEQWVKMFFARLQRANGDLSVSGVSYPISIKRAIKKYYNEKSREDEQLMNPDTVIDGVTEPFFQKSLSEQRKIRALRKEIAVFLRYLEHYKTLALQYNLLWSSVHYAHIIALPGILFVILHLIFADAYRHADFNVLRASLTSLSAIIAYTLAFVASVLSIAKCVTLRNPCGRWQARRVEIDTTLSDTIDILKSLDKFLEKRMDTTRNTVAQLYRSSPV